jgi:zinc protease
MSEIHTIHEHSTDLPLVDLRHVVRTGAVTEPAELTGVGRIALRLLRRGAAGMARRELDEAFDRIAAVVSVQATPDFYAIHVRVLRRFLERATDLVAKVMLEPELSQDELDRLRRESVAEVVTSRDDDRHLASRALRMLVFGDHPYGLTTRGTVETIERMTLDDAARFLDQHLVADAFLVGAAGDIDDVALRDCLDRTVARLPRRSPPAADCEPPVSVPGIRVVLVDKPERTQTQIFLGHVGTAYGDPHDLPLRVALTAFGGTFTSRLMREVRVERGWSYGAYASMGRGRLPDLLNMWVFPAMKDAVPCIELVLRLYEELQAEGPTPDDVAFARDFLARSMALQKDTASARLTLRLKQELLGMPDDYYDTFAERVRAVTPEQARDATAARLDHRSLAIAITCTASELAGPLRKLLGDDAVIETIPYDSPKLA